MHAFACSRGRNGSCVWAWCVCVCFVIISVDRAVCECVCLRVCMCVSNIGIDHTNRVCVSFNSIDRANWLTNENTSILAIKMENISTGVCASFLCLSHRARLNKLYTLVAEQQTRSRLCICPTRVPSGRRSRKTPPILDETKRKQDTCSRPTVFRGTELMQYNPPSL
ncbi:unnamed protein product [Ectocarpus sp. 12 AP-2014]